MFEFSGNSDIDEIRETKISQLNEFHKRYIKYSRKIKHDVYTIIKDHNTLISYGLPSEISEHFIYYEQAPWFWTYTNPISEYLQNIYNINLKRLTSNNPQKLIFDFYNKWVFSQNNLDSKYFALSVIKQVKDCRKNALNLILHGIILTYEKNLYNPTAALQEFEEAEKALLSKELNEIESFELMYTIKLYKGFLYFKMRDYTKAGEYFEESLHFKEDGITAIFHLALVSLHQGNLNSAFESAQTVFDYDRFCVDYALKNNMIHLYDFYIECSVTGYFFREEVAFDLLPIYESCINESISSAQIRIDKLKEDILSLKDMKWYKENGALIRTNLNFVELFIKQHNKSENIFILESLDGIEKKFVQSLEFAQQTIEKSFLDKIYSQLKIYEIKINEDEDLKKRLISDLEKTKVRLELKKSSTLRNFESSMDEKIRIATERVKNVEISNDLNPLNSFKNSMMYSAMLSFFVLLLGGFAEYSNEIGQSSGGYTRILSVIIFSGSKWGILTFIVGIFVAFLMSISTSFEKTKMKHRCVKDLNNLKDEKQKGQNKIKEDSIQALKSLEERTDKKIELLEAQIEELKEKRKQDEVTLRENLSQKIKIETEKLTALLTSYTAEKN